MAETSPAWLSRLRMAVIPSPCLQEEEGYACARAIVTKAGLRALLGVSGLGVEPSTSGTEEGAT